MKLDDFLDGGRGCFCWGGGGGGSKFRSEFELRKKSDIPDQSGIEHDAASPYGNLWDSVSYAHLLETWDTKYGCVGFAGYA